MSFQVKVLSRAKRDYRRILRWIQERSPAGARSWNRKWLETIDRLRDFADGCAVASEDADHDERILEITFKTRRGKRYRAIFVIRGTVVSVLAVRGPGQDTVPPDELEFPAEA
jgi:plasmid stabilization system protein ParE